MREAPIRAATVRERFPDLLSDFRSCVLHPIPNSSIRSSGVPHWRQISAWQSPHTSGSATDWAAAYNFAFQMQNCKCPPYFAAAIESTCIALLFASSVPVTVT